MDGASRGAWTRGKGGAIVRLAVFTGAVVAGCSGAPRVQRPVPATVAGHATAGTASHPPTQEIAPTATEKPSPEPGTTLAGVQPGQLVDTSLAAGSRDAGLFNDALAGMTAARPIRLEDLVWVVDGESTRGVIAYYEDRFEEALDVFEPLATAGDPQAQYFLARMYSTGRGVPQDDKANLQWLEKSAAQGYVKAQFNLGESLLRGDSGVLDIDRGLEILQEAADAGYVSAQFNLAFTYDEGISGYLPTACNMARLYYKKAADQGYAAAAINLAALLERPCFELPADPSEGFALLLDAANAGVPMAAWQLGIRYAVGLGTAPEPELARDWLLRARDAGIDRPLPAEARAALASADLLEGLE